MAHAVVDQVAERLDIPPSEARLVLNALSKLIYQQAEREGRVRVPNIGIFEMEPDGELTFAADHALKRVVNHRYAALPVAPGVEEVVTSDAPASIPPLVPPVEETPPLDAEPVPDEKPEVEEPAPATEEAVAEPAEEEARAKPTDIASPETEADEESSEPDAEEVDAPLLAAGSLDADVEAQDAADEPPTSDDKPQTEEDSSSDAPSPPPSEEPERKRAPVIAGVMLALALAAGAGWWLLSDSPPSDPADDIAAVETAPPDETEPAPADDAAPDDAEALAQPPEAVADADASDDVFPTGTEPINPSLGGFALVVASVPSADDADAIEAQFRSALEDDPLPTAVLTSETDGTTRFRVAIGQFASTDEALEAREARGDALPGDAWVLRLTADMARN